MKRDLTYFRKLETLVHARELLRDICDDVTPDVAPQTARKLRSALRSIDGAIRNAANQHGRLVRKGDAA